MWSRLIVLMTDFGYNDPFVGVMKGVIYKINPHAKIIDLAHDIPKFDIRMGSFILRTSYRYFPRGSIFCCVVDPGVGTKRRPIIIRSRNYIFVGPDNGCMSWGAMDDGIVEVVEIIEERFMVKPVSTTFHGRDIFAPVSAYISMGTPIHAFGPIIDPNSIVSAVFEEYRKCEDYYEVEVIGSDSFGNIFLSMPVGELEEDVGSVLTIDKGNLKWEARVSETFGEVPKGGLLILKHTSHGYLEIAANMDSATRILGVKPGERIRILRRH